MLIQVCLDLKVDLEELVAQEHHSPLLRVIDPGTTVGIEENQTKPSANLNLCTEIAVSTDLSLAHILKQLIRCSAAFSNISLG